MDKVCLTSSGSPLLITRLGDSPIGINDAASRARHSSEIAISFPATCLPLPIGPIPTFQNLPNSPIIYRLGYYMVAQPPVVPQGIIYPPSTNPNISSTLSINIGNYLSIISNTTLTRKIDAVDWGSAVYFAYLTLNSRFTLLNVNP
jgi:hypothetical protein